jgi:CRISPR-associated exonuclease Cas4
VSYEPDPITLSALQHWAYCPRQCGLIHLEPWAMASLHCCKLMLLLMVRSVHDLHGTHSARRLRLCQKGTSGRSGACGSIGAYFRLIGEPGGKPHGLA